MGVALVLWAPSAGAEPRFSAGKACSACHDDPTGGGLANDAGLAFAAELASFPGSAWDPRLTERARIGGIVEVMGGFSPAVHTELGEARFSAPARGELAVVAGLRGSIELVPGRASLLLDQRVSAEGAETRQAFGIVRLPADLYVRAGGIELPYGLRLRDEQAFVRDATGAVGGRAGVEVGLDGERLAVRAALASPLLDQRIGRRASATAELRQGPLSLGASFAWDDVADPRFPLATFMGGAHAGLRVGPLVGLVEVDLLEGRSSGEDFGQAMLYAAVDAELSRGLWVEGSYEAMDPVRAVAENERDRFGLRATWYPVAHVALEASCRIGRDIPQRPAGNADTVTLGVRGSL